MRTLVLIAATLAVTGALASPRAQQSEADDVEARPIAAPAPPLPGEEATAGVTRFSFIAYGDTCSSGPSRTMWNVSYVPYIPYGRQQVDLN
jgi:hypothetical protein